MDKIIGVPGFKNGDATSFGCGLNNLAFLETFGNVRIIMPWETASDLDIDLLYLPGGLDVNPASYGEVPGFKTTNQDVFKQYFYDQRLDAWIAKGTPVFGVCLGYQMLAVKFGCKLQQHLIDHPESDHRWEVAHKVKVEGKTKTYNIGVNSHHHQAVTPETFNDEHLVPIAIYQEKGKQSTIEAISHKTLPIMGVQWHPEELYDWFSHNLIAGLLNKEK